MKVRLCGHNVGKDRKGEQSLDVTRGIIAFRSRLHTYDNDAIIKSNAELPVFAFLGNEKSTDVLTTDSLCLCNPNGCRQARVTIDKDLGNNVKLHSTK